jgi:hypothetical protein
MSTTNKQLNNLIKKHKNQKIKKLLEKEISRHGPFRQRLNLI